MSQQDKRKCNFISSFITFCSLMFYRSSKAVDNLITFQLCVRQTTNKPAAVKTDKLLTLTRAAGSRELMRQSSATAGTIEISVIRQSGRSLSATKSVCMSITGAYLLKIICDLTVAICPVFNVTNAMIQCPSHFQTIPLSGA